MYDVNYKLIYFFTVMSSGAAAALKSVKEQNCLIQKCVDLLIECFERQNHALEKGLERISQSICTTFENKLKTSNEVKEEKENELDLCDQETLPYEPELKNEEENDAVEDEDLDGSYEV